MGIFPYKTSEHISLLRYSKTSCGVDFLLNTAESAEKRGWFNMSSRYQTDFYEFYFFRKASGSVLLNGNLIHLSDNTLLIISPYQQQEWHIDIDQLDYTFLIFQEEFLSQFIEDKLFMYRLLYCYQHEHPTYFPMTSQDMSEYLPMLKQIKTELHNPVADSYHMIVALLYQFLLKLNRFYALIFNLPLRLPLNNYAFQYKQLVEKHIREYSRVSDYADLMHISRVSLNKAVLNEFGVSAMHLLKQRILQEIKSDLIFTDKTVSQIADDFHFSAPNHLMRFFKQQTGQTVSEYVATIHTEGFS